MHLPSTILIQYVYHQQISSCKWFNRNQQAQSGWLSWSWSKSATHASSPFTLDRCQVTSSTFSSSAALFLSPAALFCHQQHFLMTDIWLFAPRLVINNNCTLRPMVIGRSQFNHISNLWQTLTMTVIILVCVVFSGCVILCLAWSCSKCWKGSFLRKSTMHLHLHNLECVVGRGTRMSN